MLDVLDKILPCWRIELAIDARAFPRVANENASAQGSDFDAAAIIYTLRTLSPNGRAGLEFLLCAAALRDLHGFTLRWGAPCCSSVDATTVSAGIRP